MVTRVPPFIEPISGVMLVTLLPTLRFRLSMVILPCCFELTVRWYKPVLAPPNLTLIVLSVSLALITYKDFVSLELALDVRLTVKSDATKAVG